MHNSVKYKIKFKLFSLYSVFSSNDEVIFFASVYNVVNNPNWKVIVTAGECNYEI